MLPWFAKLGHHAGAFLNTSAAMTRRERLVDLALTAVISAVIASGVAVFKDQQAQDTRLAVVVEQVQQLNSEVQDLTQTVQQMRRDLYAPRVGRP